MQGLREQQPGWHRVFRRGTQHALTFSRVCTNCPTGMEPLSRGFNTLQSGMSSLPRFLFLPPVGWAGRGGSWCRTKEGAHPGRPPGAVEVGTDRPRTRALPSLWEPLPSRGPQGLVPTKPAHAKLLHNVSSLLGKDIFLLSRPILNFKLTEFRIF